MALLDTFILWVHIVGASIWVGGSIFLGLVLAPYVRSLKLSKLERVTFMVELGKRFNKIALPSLLVLFATGIYNARYYIVQPENLNSMLGMILSIKLVLVIAMSTSYLLHTKLWNRFEKMDKHDEEELEKVRGAIVKMGRIIVILSIIILFLSAILQKGL